MNAPILASLPSPASGDALLGALRAIVGARRVLTGAQRTRRYRQGFRCGGGRALAVVCPGSLRGQWRVLQACVAADVIVSTLRMASVQLIDDGREVICPPGSTQDQLEKMPSRWGASRTR